MATHTSVLAWRVPGTGGPGGLLSLWSHRVGHDWSDLVVVVRRREEAGEMRDKAGAILFGMIMEGIFDKVMGEQTWKKWEVMQILVEGFSRQWDKQCKGVEVYIVCVSLDQGRPVWLDQGLKGRDEVTDLGRGWYVRLVLAGHVRAWVSLSETEWVRRSLDSSEQSCDMIWYSLNGSLGQQYTE